MAAGTSLLSQILRQNHSTCFYNRQASSCRHDKGKYSTAGATEPLYYQSIYKANHAPVPTLQGYHLPVPPSFTDFYASFLYSYLCQHRILIIPASQTSQHLYRHLLHQCGKAFCSVVIWLHYIQRVLGCTRRPKIKLHAKISGPTKIGALMHHMETGPIYALKRSTQFPVQKK